MGHESVICCPPLYGSSKNTVDCLSCIASYYSGCTSPYSPSNQNYVTPSASGVPHARRLPLAWVAVSPAARLIAERMEAERLVFFRFLHGSTNTMASGSDKAGNNEKEEDPVPLIFATSTSSLSTTQEAILDESNDYKDVKEQDPAGCATLLDTTGLTKFQRMRLSDASNSLDDRNLYEKPRTWEKTRCGTHVAGLITVFISARDLLKKSLADHKVCLPSENLADAQQQAPSPVSLTMLKDNLNNVWISHEVPGTPLRDWLGSITDSAKNKCEAEKATKEVSPKDISVQLQGDACGVEKIQADPVGLLSSLPREEKYLFPITALPPEVMSIPEMVNFSYPIPVVQDGKGNRNGAVVQHIPAADDQRENLKSAASTLNASRLAHWAAHLPFAHSSKSPSTSTRKCDHEEEENVDVMYRVVLAMRPDAVEKVMLGVSQWWLQRPIYPHELGYDPCPGEESKKNLAPDGKVRKTENGVLVPIQLKIASLAAASVFYIPLKMYLLCRFMVFVCYVHACLAFCLTLCDSATAASWLPSEKIAEWCGLTTTQSDHSNEATHRAKFLRPVDMKPPAPRTFLVSLLFALSIAVAIPLLVLILFVSLLLHVLSQLAWHLHLGQPSILMSMFSLIKHAMLSFMPHGMTVCAHEWLQNQLRERAGAMEAYHWLYRLGFLYANQLYALDVSHTGICGTHLLAFALGNHTATHDGESLAPNRVSALRALDVAGCLFLDHSCDASLFQTELEVRTYLGLPCALTRKDMSSDATTLEEVLAYSKNLKMLSHAGRALARLSLGLQRMDSHKKNGLQLINASGSHMDSEALDELGQCALLYELEAVYGHAVLVKPRATDSEVHAGDLPSKSLSASIAVTPSCSLVAINLTSCRKVRSLNALSYVTSLVQILAPFTDVSNDGVVHLDGSAFHQVLACVAKSICHSKPPRFTCSEVKHTTASKVDAKCGEVASIATLSPPHTTTSFETLLRRFVDAYAGGKLESVDDVTDIKSFLELRFQSHLYHLDLTFCFRVESLGSVCGRQWVLHYLNVSHTNIRTTGLAAAAAEWRPPGPFLSSSSSSSALVSRPLRVLVAEYCNVLNTLDGLELFPGLTKLYVRNGSLDTEGLRVFSAHPSRFAALVLLDLSYCDKVEDVHPLAALPSLETLILDNTEISQGGVKALRGCPVLRTLSLRFCPDFAPIGTSKERLDQMVVHIPTLQNYVFENFACDESPCDELEDNKKTGWS